MSSDRSDRASGNPYDEAADITQEFWGTTRGWVPRRPDDVAGDDTTGTLRALRGGLSALRPRQVERPGRRAGRTRQHGVVRSEDELSHRQAPAGEPATDVDDGWPFDDHDDWQDDGAVEAAVEVPLTPARQVVPLAERLGVGAVDPLLLRLGALLLIGVLMAPLALALRSGDGESIRTGHVPLAAAAYMPRAAGPQAAASAEAVAASTTSTSPPTSTPASSSTPTTSASAPVEAAQEPAAEPAVATAEAERIVPACPQKYEASPGDSWYRIADAAGISPGELLRENGATVHTVILPGDPICLPAGAKMPSPLLPPTTAAPATTAPATTVPSAPATTKPPATTVPLSPAEVEQIIRDVWPDELEEQALEVAWRESGHRPGAYNGWCCYGLFQIHWGAHKSWLGTVGIHDTDDLRDARKNAEAAYLIYQRAGGWGPWGA